MVWAVGTSLPTSLSASGQMLSVKKSNGECLTSELIACSNPFADLIVVSIGLWCVKAQTTTSDLSAIQVRYGVVTNANSEHNDFVANFTLINSGAQTINTGTVPVSIYACLIRLV